MSTPTWSWLAGVASVVGVGASSSAGGVLWRALTPNLQSESPTGCLVLSRRPSLIYCLGLFSLTQARIACVSPAMVSPKVARSSGGRLARKAEQVDQRGMLDEIGAQVGHVALVLVQLDEKGGDEGRTGRRLRTGPGAVAGPLGELRPGQRPEEGAVLLDDRVGGDPGGQRSVGVRQREG